MSSSSTSSRSSQPPSGRKRKYTEQELRSTLDLLNSIPRPLSPTLPPSPPASPAPPSQRRRTSPDTEHTATPAPSTPSPAPTRRPALTSAELSRMIPIYKERAKLFKRSGDSRKRTELRSRRLGLLELTDSVLHFAYVFWAEDREKSKGKSIMMCDVGTWRTLEGLVVACKGGWSKDNDPAARGLIGMLNLLEGLVLSRIAHWNIFTIRETTKGLIIPPSNSTTSTTTALNPNSNTGATPNPNAAGTPKNHPTPPSHVPSPAPTTSRSPVPPPAQQPHHPLPPFFLQNILKHSSGFLQSSSNIAHAYSMLNPAFMHTHYPRTHQICSTTSLGARSDGGHEGAFARLSDDGLEVDLDACARGEGLWAWPITCGAGMAHLIGFGRSMLWEFAHTRGGYRTHHGVNEEY
ncbi:hypothetical protein RSOLAG1IB_04113 [Rhizoctonia solani AG-1 IB]|uniref:Uncharacterized protein n=2 Tax=Rhizoctonia solani TaxID=456999 RepID=M5BKD1_THACB|nr:unnamed protein product [Rhizoctonia solani]CCO27151.1 hypothetical protein BN14_01186 [Rhizoctonia solani AG-1 IB]CEL60874.1 hypothetical protein RSOLAG1IB_04113 [Rhizoctonia solani AG-1 IB]